MNEERAEVVENTVCIRDSNPRGQKLCQQTCEDPQCVFCCWQKGNEEKEGKEELENKPENLT